MKHHILRQIPVLGRHYEHRPWRRVVRVRHGRWVPVVVLAVALLGSWPVVLVSSAPPPAASPTSSVSVSANVPSSQRVGTTITWTASATHITSPVYRFSVISPHGVTHMVRDFSQATSFQWTPMYEGTYQIQATVKAGYMATTSLSVAQKFVVTSRVTGKQAVVSATSNPMVALYSAPACASGTDTVLFRPAAGGAWQSMAPQTCTAGQSMNVFVAGMRANTRYLLHDVLSSGGHTTTSAPLSFTTGKPSSKLTIVTFGVKTPPTTQSDGSTPVLFHDLIPNPNPKIANPVGTDMSGHLTWYYDTLKSGLTMVWPLRLLGGGTFILAGRDTYHKTGDNVLREVDLAGNTVRETNIDAVNAQLTRRGQEIVYSFHHDALLLPSGDLAVLANTMKKVNGHDMMGDMIIVLDANWQVAWTWDAFNYLSTSRHAAAGEVCNLTYPQSLCALPDPKAEDWLHSNSLGWSPSDNNLTLSVRHQNWVLKLDYNNGKGSGKILWRLGQDGTFALSSGTTSSWFSHQHDAHYIDNTHLTLFDNGNTRCNNGTVKNCDSRGQEWVINEQTHVATLVLDSDLGNYSMALGSSQLLPDGDIYFGLGLPSGRSIEVTPAGKTVYEQDTYVGEYRVYRVSNLDINPSIPK